VQGVLPSPRKERLKLVTYDFYKIRKSIKVMPNISLKYESVLDSGEV